MKFYTYVRGIGSQIYHRYVENGKHYQEIVNEFPIKLFMESNKTKDSIGLMGESLNEFSFTNIRDAKEFVEQYKTITPIHGQTSFVHQFITNTYPSKIEFNINDIIIANIDIETAFGTSEFPDSHKVTIKQGDETKKLTLGSFKLLPDFEEISILDERISEWTLFNSSCYRLIGGFPKAESANQEILSISLKCFNTAEVVTW